MTWLTHHKASEVAAANAHDAKHQGRYDEAARFFCLAAEEEIAALRYIKCTEKPRTFGVTAVSAVALLYKAKEFRRSEQLAHSILAEDRLPHFAAEQLRELLQTIWNEQAQASSEIKFVPGQVTISIDGGDIVKGGAPLDLIVERVQTIQAIFYRTAEHLSKLPLRKHGPASKEIQNLCRPWLFQSIPGSYQFTVAIQGPSQLDMFKGDPEPRLIAETFMSILENTVSEEPDESLKKTVPDEGYRNTFLKLTRNLAPSGKSFNKMEIRSSESKSPVLLTPESRRNISQTIRKSAEVISLNTKLQSEHVYLKGTLRALDLNKDWLELYSDNQLIRIINVGDAVDDVIGPMVNQSVIVQALRDNDTYTFIDIEPDDEN